MRRLSKELQFEDAARVRDRIIALRRRLSGEDTAKEDDADVAMAIAAAPKQKTTVRNWRRTRRGP
jgi:excinuclease UvrABC nuclease subunit